MKWLIMDFKKPLYTITVPSTDFIAEAYWHGKGVTPTIRFGFNRDGINYQGGIEFRQVLAMRKRAERCCTAWHIKDAYDTLVEIVDSSWINEINADTDSQWKGKWETII